MMHVTIDNHKNSSSIDWIPALAIRMIQSDIADASLLCIQSTKEM